MKGYDYDDYEALVGKTIKVLSMGEADEKDRRYEGHIGKVLRVTLSPWGFQIWLEGMSLAVLSEVDTWEVIEDGTRSEGN
jgi:hypothetical protein